MNLRDEYFERAEEILGDGSPGEEQYDAEVLKGLRQEKSIREALAQANRKYPEEALRVEESNLEDVRAHYEYLAAHEKILAMLAGKDGGLRGTR